MMVVINSVKRKFVAAPCQFGVPTNGQRSKRGSTILEHKEEGKPPRREGRQDWIDVLERGTLAISD